VAKQPFQRPGLLGSLPNFVERVDVLSPVQRRLGEQARQQQAEADARVERTVLGLSSVARAVAPAALGDARTNQAPGGGVNLLGLGPAVDYFRGDNAVFEARPLTTTVANGATRVGARAAARIAPSGEVAPVDVDRIGQIAAEAARVVNSSPGATGNGPNGEGGPPAGLSDRGATNLGRAISVPLGALTGAAAIGAAREVRGAIVDGTQNLRLGMMDIGGSVRDVGDKVAAKLDLAATGQALGVPLGAGIRDGLAAVGGSLAQVSGSGGIPININLNTAELTRTTTIGVVGILVALTAGTALGIVGGRSAAKLLDRKGGAT